ncbi:hypothetical protein BO71DRAFT_428784 [Aspergillus ellipticus CBS 707.79]|uniref:Uncharacterized protein n=1 Tax=Aspergillus ellipticus CBS 707.79 TaxID=1448320 RepID=A0A319DE61_9EURO|nr:hypothetical protein BO71DRAFT_428784 [Aspergillus ellipticus CBS 707.79]
MPESMIEGDERPLRSEVLLILSAISTRLALPQFEKHMVIPVMIISVMFRKARILQAHWNGQRLVIGISPLFELDKKEMDNYNIFTRYMAGNPTGDTKNIPNPRIT